jgi:hypothetical protein
MTITAITKQELYQTIESLPPKSLDELALFLDFLAHKHRLSQAGAVIPLGGLWKDVLFDVDDSHIRALRREITTHLAAQVNQ